MPKSKSEMMSRLRKQRQAAGLVEVRNIWVTPAEREKIIEYAKRLKQK